jgi:hypothetical protein
VTTSNPANIKQPHYGAMIHVKLINFMRHGDE